MSGHIEISNGRESVKIYTTSARGKDLFQVAFYHAGRRERRSFANRAKARREAKLILTQLSSASAEVDEAVTTPEVESLVAARKSLNGIDCPLHLAVETFAECVKLLGDPKDPLTSVRNAVVYYRKHHPVGAERVSLKEMTQRFLESRKRRGLSEAYVSSVGVTMNTFLKAFPNAGCELPSGEEVVQWLEKRFTSPVTRNSNLRTVKTLALWAKKQNLVSQESISKVELWKEAAGEIEIYTPDELRSILRTVPSMMVPSIVIGAFAGLRVAEARRLDWRDINLSRGFITVAASKAKTAARRLVPIQENLKAWLKPYARESGEIAPFARGYMCQVIREKKLPNKRNALRHSYISYRLAMIQDTPRVALECGNSPEMIFQHYRELVMPEEAKEWFAIMPE